MEMNELSKKAKDMETEVEKTWKEFIEVFESNARELESVLERIEEAIRVKPKNMKEKTEKAYEQTSSTSLNYDRGYHYVDFWF